MIYFIMYPFFTRDASRYVQRSLCHGVVSVCDIWKRVNIFSNFSQLLVPRLHHSSSFSHQIWQNYDWSGFPLIHVWRWTQANGELRQYRFDSCRDITGDIRMRYTVGKTAPKLPPTRVFKRLRRK